MVAIVDGSVQLKDFDKAWSMLKSMQQWLDDNQSKKDDRTSGYAMFQGRYFRAAGDVAEAKGHKLDAAGFFA
jgi:pentatricopeptide repeat protein